MQALRISACLDQLTLLVTNISNAIATALDATRPCTQDVRILAMITTLLVLYDEMYDASLLAQPIFSAEPSWDTLCSGPSGPATALRIEKEHACLIEALSTSTLLSLRLFTLLLGTGEGCGSINKWLSHTTWTAFDISWRMLSDSGRFVQLWPVEWPPVPRETHQTYLAAQDQLLSWLLHFIRGKSTRWLQTKATLASSDETAQDRLCNTLQPAIICVHDLHGLTGEKIHDAVSMLPSGFLSKLCCLLCEGPLIGGKTTLTESVTLDLSLTNTFQTSVVSFTAAIGRCLLVAAAQVVPGSRTSLGILCPAVLEVARLAIVMTSRAGGHPHTQLQASHLSMSGSLSQSVLFQQTEQPVLHTKHNAVGGGITPASSENRGPVTSRCVSRTRDHTKSGSSNCSSDGDVFQAGDLVPRVRTRDLVLFHALRDALNPTSKECSEGMMVMLCVMRMWGDRYGMTSPDEQVACLHVALQHLTRHTCGWMQMQRGSVGQHAVEKPLLVVAMTKMRALLTVSMSTMGSLTAGGVLFTCHPSLAVSTGVHISCGESVRGAMNIRAWEGGGEGRREGGRGTATDTWVGERELLDNNPSM